MYTVLTYQSRRIKGSSLAITRQLAEVVYSTWLKLHNNALKAHDRHSATVTTAELAQNVFVPQQCGQVQWPIVAHFRLARRHISVKLKITNLYFKYTLIYM